MAANKAFRAGPVALTTTLTTDILNCNITSAAGPVGFTGTDYYLIIRHISIVNKTGSNATFSLYLGATGANAAGTEIIGIGTTVAGNSRHDWYGMLRLDAADFIVGGSNTATALTILFEGEIGVI